MTAKADTRLRRLPERGSKDLDLACDIIDEALIAHVGFTFQEQPYVVPMALGRDGSDLLLHGSVVSRLMKSLANGVACCVTITHLDGLVLARSSFSSSMNYRSLMVFGTATEVSDIDEKDRGLNILVDHLARGRADDVRRSTRKELNATTLIRLPIETFSIKTRSGPPSDTASDLDQQVWAGVIPIKQSLTSPVTTPDMRFKIAVPGYVIEKVND